MEQQAIAVWRGDLKGRPRAASSTRPAIRLPRVSGHPISITNSLHCIRQEHIATNSYGKVGLSTSVNCKAKHLNAINPSLSRASYSWKKISSVFNR